MRVAPPSATERTTAWQAVLLVCAFTTGLAAQSVAAVYTSGVPAYLEALKPFRQSLEASGATVLVVELADAASLPQLKAALALDPALVVTFGSAARAAVAGLPSQVPMMSTMVLADQESDRPAVTVSLEVPAAQILARLRSVFPDRRRVTLLYNPAGTPVNKADLLASAQRLGIALAIVPCDNPRQLIETIGSLRGRTDFVWCLPDASLYQPATITPLVLASIRNLLPIIGFSEAFVKAGALAGFYADPRDIGLQTADAVRRFLDHPEVSAVEPPRTVTFAVNARISQLLGIRWNRAGDQGSVVLK